MDPVFDTTAWVMETMLVMVALLAAIPVLKAVAGLSLVFAARALGIRQSRVHRVGLALLPAFLRTALGVTAGLGVLAAPVAAAEPPKPVIVIDRIVELPPTAVTPPAAQRLAPTPTSTLQTSAPAAKTPIRPSASSFPSKPISAAITPAPTASALPRVKPLAAATPAVTQAATSNSMTRPARSAQPGASYRVQTGDSLWEIAKQSLTAAGGDFSNRQVDRVWRLIWQANYDVIGSDPSLIRPGQLLEIPSSLGE